MRSKNKLNGAQILGIILAAIGILFIIFPTEIGTLALRLMTFFFLIMGFYGLIAGAMIRSRATLLSSALIVFSGFYAFANPESVLFLLGVVCLISGVNSFYILFKKRHHLDERSVISASLLILLGVFAALNSKAALGTVVVILGIVIVSIGLIVFFVGNKFRVVSRHNFTYTDYYTADYDYTPPKKDRIVVNIQSDDVEEVDYKEL